jgi:hypothetical protein
VKDDDKLESFFKTIKKADEQLLVPPFLKRIEPTRRERPLFLYAATTVVVIVAVVLLVLQDRNSIMQHVDILVPVGENPSKTNSLLDEKSLLEWESPTDFLSEDF